MGCDIHIYRERYVNGGWETDTTVEIEDEGGSNEYKSFESGCGYYSRSYWLFAALSNVRSYGDNLPVPPPAKGRGFPNDVTKIHDDCKESWDSDGHSHGWLTLAELKRLKEQYENAMVTHGDNPDKWGTIAEYIGDCIKQVSQGGYFDGLPDEDCRIVFFYDN